MNSNSYYGTAVYQASGGAVPPAGANGTGDQQTSTTTNANNVSVANPTTLQKPGEAETNTANYFRPAVSRAYGENFGNSPILPSYFFNRMTRD
jgi:hypothetical protein